MLSPTEASMLFLLHKKYGQRQIVPASVYYID